MLGSNTGDENGRALLKNGANEYIGRPFSPSELLSRIHAALKSARREEPGGLAMISQAFDRLGGHDDLDADVAHALG